MDINYKTYQSLTDISKNENELRLKIEKVEKYEKTTKNETKLLILSDIFTGLTSLLTIACLYLTLKDKKSLSSFLVSLSSTFMNLTAFKQIFNIRNSDLNKADLLKDEIASYVKKRWNNGY